MIATNWRKAGGKTRQRNTCKGASTFTILQRTIAVFGKRAAGIYEGWRGRGRERWEGADGAAEDRNRRGKVGSNTYEL